MNMGALISNPLAKSMRSVHGAQVKQNDDIVGFAAWVEVAVNLVDYLLHGFDGRPMIFCARQDEVLGQWARLEPNKTCHHESVMVQMIKCIINSDTTKKTAHKTEELN